MPLPERPITVDEEVVQFMAPETQTGAETLYTLLDSLEVPLPGRYQATETRRGLARLLGVNDQCISNASPKIAQLLETEGPVPFSPRIFGPFLMVLSGRRDISRETLPEDIRQFVGGLLDEIDNEYHNHNFLTAAEAGDILNLTPPDTVRTMNTLAKCLNYPFELAYPGRVTDTPHTVARLYPKDAVNFMRCLSTDSARCFGVPSRANAAAATVLRRNLDNLRIQASLEALRSVIPPLSRDFFQHQLKLIQIDNAQAADSWNRTWRLPNQLVPETAYTACEALSEKLIYLNKATINGKNMATTLPLTDQWLIWQLTSRFKYLRYLNAQGSDQDIFRSLSSTIEKARKIAYRNNLGLIKHSIKIYTRRYPEAEKVLTPEDMIGIGIFALSTAITNYEPKFGWAFSTYAVDVAVKRLIRQYNQECRNVGREVDVFSKGEYMDVNESTHEEILSRLTYKKKPGLSSISPVEGTLPFDLLADLTEVERMVVRLRYEFDYTISEIATSFALDISNGRKAHYTDERIRQIHRGALAKIRNIIEEDND